MVAVDGVTLDVQDGEFMVFLGPSGCGKTTTLRMVAGLETTSGGDIFIGERRVNDLSPKERDIAMVFQNYALYPHMSVFENMAFALQLRKMPGEEIARRVREAADLLGLEGLLERRPRQLSGGQRQRVALGRAIVREPAAFLMDEPLSNLDAQLRAQMRTELIRLHRRLGSTTMYVTHDQVEALTMGHRIVVMNGGTVQQVGTPREIYDRPRNRFVAAFIGSPTMNLVDCEVGSSQGATYLSSPILRYAVKPEQARLLAERGAGGVTVGFRPEDVTLHDGAGPLDGRIAAGVDVVETLGSELHVYLVAEGATIVAKTGADAPVRVGARLSLEPHPERIHVFERESGVALW
ncbi:MAG: sn-glycerol-3-phosphate ABC transporter ATP-binding protein UgpC [bacterium]|nr:sn-glycerol-3-phosphate ABC transporter ATP-binding protein UgpC [bacterium]